MNIEHLRLFVRLATSSSISGAGAEMGLSAAVASSWLVKLEQDLGVRLLHRTTRSVSLTEDGSSFLPYAEEVIHSVDAARAAVWAGDDSPSGTLRITAPASFGRQHLLSALPEFYQRFPQLNVDLRLSDSIVDLVGGGFDLAVRISELKDSSLVARKLAPDKRIICASPDYLRQHGEPEDLAQLEQHHCLTLAGLEQWSFDTPDGRRSIRAAGRFKTDNGEALREASVMGLGISVASTWSVYRHVERGELVPVLQKWPLVSESAIWVVYPSKQTVAPKVRAFVTHFSALFGDPPYWDADSGS